MHLYAIIYACNVYLYAYTHAFIHTYCTYIPTYTCTIITGIYTSISIVYSPYSENILSMILASCIHSHYIISYLQIVEQ